MEGWWKFTHPFLLYERVGPLREEGWMCSVSTHSFYLYEGTALSTHPFYLYEGGPLYLLTPSFSMRGGRSMGGGRVDTDRSSEMREPPMLLA